MNELNPKEKAELFRAFDRVLLPVLKEVSDGSATPEVRTFEYNPERWSLAMEWLERRASIDLLRGLKQGEPPLSDPRHEAWQEHYDKFKERITGFIKLRAAGIVDDPETVYFAVSIFQRINDFSQKALEYLQVHEKPTLGMAERPPETEVILAQRDDSN